MLVNGVGALTRWRPERYGRSPARMASVFVSWNCHTRSPFASRSAIGNVELNPPTIANMSNVTAF